MEHCISQLAVDSVSINRECVVDPAIREKICASYQFIRSILRWFPSYSSICLLYDFNSRWDFGSKQCRFNDFSSNWYCSLRNIPVLPIDIQSHLHSYILFHIAPRKIGAEKEPRFKTLLWFFSNKQHRSKNINDLEMLRFWHEYFNTSLGRNDFGHNVYLFNLRQWSDSVETMLHGLSHGFRYVISNFAVSLEKNNIRPLDAGYRIIDGIFNYNLYVSIWRNRLIVGRLFKHR